MLGVTQGLTEFLPISSSGHLILVPWLADWHYLEAHPDFNKTFDVALHLGTLVAVVAYFWARRAALVAARGRSVAHRRSRPTTSASPGGSSSRRSRRRSSARSARARSSDHLGEPWQIAILLAVFGVLLWVRRPPAPARADRGLGFGTAFWSGSSQTLALMPGVSRSGITITAGRFLGLDRDAAARFSFLLLIPIVFGAVVFKGVKTSSSTRFPPARSGRSWSGRLPPRGRADRDRPPARLRAPARLHALRDLPAGARGGDRDRDRQRLARRHF